MLQLLQLSLRRVKMVINVTTQELDELLDTFFKRLREKPKVLK